MHMTLDSTNTKSHDTRRWHLAMSVFGLLLGSWQLSACKQINALSAQTCTPACAGAETCVEGVCRALCASPLDCQDGQVCEKSVCWNPEELDDGVIPIDGGLDGQSCDDGLACTQNDVWFNGVCRGQDTCGDCMECNAETNACEAAAPSGVELACSNGKDDDCDGIPDCDDSDCQELPVCDWPECETVADCPNDQCFQCTAGGRCQPLTVGTACSNECAITAACSLGQCNTLEAVPCDLGGNDASCVAQSCIDDGNGGTCEVTPLDNGETCPGGVCHDGQCIPNDDVTIGSECNPEIQGFCGPGKACSLDLEQIIFGGLGGNISLETGYRCVEADVCIISFNQPELGSTPDQETVCASDFEALVGGGELPIPKQATCNQGVWEDVRCYVGYDDACIKFNPDNDGNGVPDFCNFDVPNPNDPSVIETSFGPSVIRSEYTCGGGADDPNTPHFEPETSFRVDAVCNIATCLLTDIVSEPVNDCAAEQDGGPGCNEDTGTCYQSACNCIVECEDTSDGHSDGCSFVVQESTNGCANPETAQCFDNASNNGDTASCFCME